MKTAAFTKTYPGGFVLRLPELTLETGKVYAVIGANGSGKSTFARLLAGVTRPDRETAGHILPAGCTVGYMPQENYAFRMTVRANVLLGGGDRARAEEWLEALQIRHLADKRANTLSGGETARMALARLLMKRFDLLVLDEPTAAMDMEGAALAEDLMLRYVRETGCTMLLVTHSIQQARRIAGEGLFFHRGTVLETGPAERLLYTPARPETRQFLDFYGT